MDKIIDSAYCYINLNQAYSMPIAKLDDVDLYYEVKGKGHPTVLINGYGGTSDTWDDSEPVTQTLSKTYQIITQDNRGTGRSSQPEGPYSTSIMADDIANLLDHLSLPKANIIGVSMGGMIAQEVALRHPEIVNKLVLVCTTPGGEYWDIPGQSEAGEKLTWFFNPPENMSMKDIQREVLGLVYYPDYLAVHKERIMNKVPAYPVAVEIFKKQYSACMSHDTIGRLDSLDVGTLVIHGLDDLLIFPECGEALAERIPNAELLMYSNAGHAVHVEKWSEVRPKLLSFLE